MTKTDEIRCLGLKLAALTEKDVVKINDITKRLDELNTVELGDEKTNKLKPCPFCRPSCDGEAFCGVDGGEDSPFTYHVSCRGCGACVQDYSTETEAIKAWNTRPYTDRIEAELKEIWKMVDRIASSEQCQGCNKGPFPSSACCNCVFDSVSEMADYVDEKRMEYQIGTIYWRCMK